MAEPIRKEDLKEALTEVLEPFAENIKEDFSRVDKRFEKVDKRFERIESTLIAVVEDLKEARKERRVLEKRINDTYYAVDGFVKIVAKLEDEFTLMKEDIRRVKAVIKEKLGVDLE